MAFTMDGIIIDRIQMATAEDFDGNVLYTLTQLADATIDVTAESKEARDANGTLIKTFYTGKSGTFTANNAMLDFNILSASTGSDKQVAASNKKIKMPGIKTVKASEKSVKVPGLIADSVKIVGIAGNGTKIAEYEATKDYTASADTITLPTAPAGDVAQFVVRFDRNVESGVKVMNSATEFPGTVRLLLKALAVDPCSADTVRSVYILLPSFQVSPETSLSLTTDAQLQYTGSLQTDYCSADKTLYEIYFAEDDVE